MLRTANANNSYSTQINRTNYNLPLPYDGGDTYTIPCGHCSHTHMFFRSFKYGRRVQWELVCVKCGENHMVYSR